VLYDEVSLKIGPEPRFFAWLGHFRHLAEACAALAATAENLCAYCHVQNNARKVFVNFGKTGSGTQDGRAGWLLSQEDGFFEVPG